MKILARTGAKGEPMATLFNLIIKFTVKKENESVMWQKRRFFENWEWDLLLCQWFLEVEY